MAAGIASYQTGVEANSMSDRPTKQFRCRYFHDGAWWGLQITAYDWHDAEIRAQKLGAQLDGEVGATVPALPGAGIAVRVWTTLKNLRGRKG